jgi:hypothetical protein
MMVPTECNKEGNTVKRRIMLRPRASIGSTERSNDVVSEDRLPLRHEESGSKSRRGGASSMGCVRRQVVSLRHSWTLLPAISKVSVCIFSSFLIIHIVLGTLDVWFHYYGLGDVKHMPTRNTSAAFAVVINTYRRPRMLQEAVTHYADTCGRTFGVDQVFIVWADPETTPPELSDLFLTEHTESNNRASVDVLKKKKDSLNSRFEPIPQLKSDAIFMVDDDVRVSCPSLALGFQAWTAFPNVMVGYYPRLASPPRTTTRKQGEFVYHGWPTVFFGGTFNFVLTKAAFLHKQYLAIYSDETRHPREILHHVDEHRNCEDVAMSLVIANYTRGASHGSYPIYVEGSVVDKGLFGGISTGSGHMTTRSDCLTALTKIYKDHGWGIPLSFQASLKQQSFVHHYPGFWWQYGPSNFFEWFALSNVFS